MLFRSVDSAVLQQELAALEAFRQFFANGLLDDALSCGAEEALMVADSENMAAEDAWQPENPASVTNPASREANALARIVFMVVDFLPELF